MRVSNSVLATLLGATAPADAAPAIAPAAAASAASALTTSTASTTSAPTSLRFELARALPALWAKARREAAAGRASDKETLRALVLWFLQKKQVAAIARQSVQYRHAGRGCRGQVDLLARPQEGTAVAIEIDWAYSLTSLEKLRAAHQEGWEALWICGAPMTRINAKALRTRANAELGGSFAWLHMFHLEHGWL